MSIIVPNSVYVVILRAGCRNIGPRLQASWVHKLTSFSPQILLMMELEAGLAEGPRTATTPFDMIWHTARKQRGVGWDDEDSGLKGEQRQQETKSVCDIQVRKVHALLKKAYKRKLFSARC